ncbi:D-amino acid dehydrogenase [Ferrovibrio sp.]|uniref:D-amino acid dehydrogenase n=1 Tax=Ferrovibrio sp. TaxID=1917215 RepID=UPI003511E886
MDIIVIGAGVIGLTTARRLAQDGHRVRVIDRAPVAGQGASRANGAQLSYSYVAPMADPSVWAALPKYLFGRDSPMRFRPGLDWRQYHWLLKFLAACTRREALATTEKLLRLAFLSRDELHAAQDVRQLDFAWARSGKLVVYSTAAGLAAAQAQADFQNARGCRQQAVGRDGCLAIEPALAGIAGRIAGGIFTPDDEACDPHALCRGLAERLAGPAGGVEFQFSRRVLRLHRTGRRLAGIETDAGLFTADAYVLAAGLESRALAEGIGLSLPIYPVKGYSLSLPIANDDAAPRVSVTDTLHKVVYARLGGMLRVAGMADLVGADASIDPARLGQLARQARETFPQAAIAPETGPWCGLRPATPKGLPLLGDCGIDGLLLNTGHGALGLTLAFGSAAVIAAGLAGRPSPVALADFSHRAA